MLRRPTLLLAAAVAAAGTLALADSHEDAPPAVKARQGQMQLQSFYLGILGNMARGNAEYDAEAAQEAADSLVGIHQDIAWAPLWPEGTSTEEVPSSRALPAIWTDRADFDEDWDEFGEAAEALQAVAGDGLEGMQGAVGALGRTCGGCHDDHRQSN